MILLRIVAVILCTAVCSALRISFRRKYKAAVEPDMSVYISHKPFSLQEYLERRENLALELIAEQEAREPYVITLWWGFDGLRLNADGTTEWISRRPEPKPETVCPALQNGYTDCSGAAQSLASILQDSIQNQIRSLQMQRMQSQLQTLQASQMLQPPIPYCPGQFPSPYFSPMYYNSLAYIQNCCCTARTLDGRIARDTI